MRLCDMTEFVGSGSNGEKKWVFSIEKYRSAATVILNQLTFIQF